jgi:RNA polymerase sigma-70 factor, ECF subfamily
MNKESLDSLVYRLQNDDARAFEMVFDTLFEPLLKKAIYYVRDRDVAKDIVQEIFLNVWKNRQSLSTGVPLKNYLERACINRALNHLRDEGKFRCCVEEEAASYIPALIDESPHEQVVFDELQENIFQFIEALPEKVKLPFVLSRFEHMTYREIARATGLSEVVVERSIMKALKRLRVYLSGTSMTG